MVRVLQQKIKDSAIARWTVLGLVSFSMLTGYLLTDAISPLKTMFEQELGWSSEDYGIFTSGYGLFNIFLLMLIFGGMILDKKGVRYTGVLSILLMIGGTALKYWAISTDFGAATTQLSLFGIQLFSMKSQVLYATVGFGIFGVGVEMVAITATKVIVKWFKKGSLALALGVNLAAGRLGIALALFGSYSFAEAIGDPSAPLLLSLALLCIGFIAFLLFCVMDRRFDREEPEAETISAEASFSVSDIISIVKIRAFWLLTILCLLFYSAVFPYLKFAAELMVQKFQVSPSLAGMIPAIIPLWNILLAPLFGTIYDRKGRGATIMIIGTVLLVVAHVVFAIPGLESSWIAIAMTVLLGIAFSLLPAAMWPSVPKIIPNRMLGTAYSLIFWVQNWGLAGIPLLVGYLLNDYCIVGEREVDGVMITSYDYTLPMVLFALLGLLSVLLSVLLRREDLRKGYGLESPSIETGN